MKPRSWLPSAALVLAGWWIYAPALHGGWIWDDRVDITENTVLRDPAGWWKIWFAPQGLDYYPLKTGVQWIQWRLWGLDPFGYHLTNLGLHLLSGFLFWALLRRLGVRLAWLGGLLFVVHPLAVESVAWVVELKNTLSLPLLLGAMLAYLAYDETRRPGKLIGAWLLFLAAMLGKTSVVMFPFVLLLHAWWKRGRIGRRDLAASAPFFAVSLALGLATIWLQQHRTIGTAVVPMGGVLSRLAGAGLSAAFYFSKFFVPLGLSPVYGRWRVDPPAFWQFWPWALLIFGWKAMAAARSTFRHLLLGLGFFLLNLAPILGFVTVSFMRFTAVMDHLAYLPMLGLAGLTAAAAGSAERWTASAGAGGRRRAVRLLLWAVVGAVLLALAIDSRRLAATYRGEESFWTRAVAMRPEAWPARNNLGIALEGAGRLPEAVAQYREAVRLEPGNAESHFNLGIALGREGLAADAIAQYETSIKLQPNFLGAYFNLADALAAAGRWPEAIADYQAALRLEPRHVEAHNNLGTALNRVGRVPEAIAQFEAALALDPADAEAHNNLGVAFAESGRFPEAIVQFRAAVRLRPDYANALRNLRRAEASTAGRP